MARALDLFNQTVREGEPLAYYELGWLFQRKGETQSARRMCETGAALGYKRSLSGLFDSASKDDTLEAQRWLYRYVRRVGIREYLGRWWQSRRLI